MARLLPPLVLLVVFALVAWRCAREPSRAWMRARIVGVAQAGAPGEAGALLGTYRERFGEPEDLRFVVRAWFRLGRPDEALRVALEDGPGRPPALSVPDLAETALLAVGWQDAARTRPTALEPPALLALVEGGHPWATRRLEEHARLLELQGLMPYYFHAYRLGTRAPLALLVRTFRERDGEPFRVAAALGSPFEAGDPARDEDVALLAQVVQSAAWMRREHPLWVVAALSLGRSGSPQATEAFDRAERRLAEAGGEPAARDRRFVQVGRLAGGDWTVDDDLARALLGRSSPGSSPGSSPDGLALSWYLEALLHRFRAGDARSEQRLGQIWEGPGARLPDLRTRMVRAMLLGDDLPDARARATWVPRIVAVLEARDAPPLHHVLAAAWRLRDGEAGAQEALLGILRQVAVDLAASPGGAAGSGEAFVEALRALVLYARTA